MQNRSALKSSPSGRSLVAAAVTVGLGLAFSLGLGGGVREASAQVALEEEEESTPPPPPTAEQLGLVEPTHIGLGLRLRNVRVPKSLLEAFVERASGGSSNFGIGLEVSRRKSNFEFQFGLEYEKIFIEPGHWIDKGDSIPQDEADFVEFEDFGWVTIEATFLYHTEITKQFALRYGGGAGLGIFFGDVVRTDEVCTNSSVESCHEKPGAENVKEPYENIPPVFLVVNAIFGVQIRPTNELFINIEGGLRTMPFFGTTLGYYFCAARPARAAAGSTLAA
jgi:hypothetical protein